MIDPYRDQRTLGWQPLAVALLLGVLLSFFSANPLLTLASLALLIAILKLFWRPGEPPILLFAMAYHWVQASLLTFSANLQNTALQDLPEATLHLTRAAWLTLGGVLAVALGLRMGGGRAIGDRWHQWRDESAARFSIPRLFRASLLAMVLAEIVTAYSGVIAGLRQPLLALANLHWVVIFLFTYTCMARRQGFPQLALVSALEVLVGLMGYFSGFRTILILLVLGTLATPRALRGVRIPILASMGVATVLLFLLWTGIKKDYRLFLNQGSGDQVAVVPLGQRLDKLLELTLETTPEKMAKSVETLADRITYIRFFSESIGVVPDQIPHENGLLWREALVNSVVPRLLNPNKRILDDSARTSYYTGGYVYGMQEGASISLGYIAESYIDFGPFGMFVPLFLWGLFVGFVYRTLLRSTPNLLWNYGCVTTLIVLNASMLESSNVKIVGGMVMGWLVLLLVNRKLAPRIIRQLEQPEPARLPDGAAFAARRS